MKDFYLKAKEMELLIALSYNYFSLGIRINPEDTEDEKNKTKERIFESFDKILFKEIIKTQPELLPCVENFKTNIKGNSVFKAFEISFGDQIKLSSIKDIKVYSGAVNNSFVVPEISSRNSSKMNEYRRFIKSKIDVMFPIFHQEKMRFVNHYGGKSLLADKDAEIYLGLYPFLNNKEDISKEELMKILDACYTNSSTKKSIQKAQILIELFKDNEFLLSEKLNEHFKFVYESDKELRKLISPYIKGALDDNLFSEDIVFRVNFRMPVLEDKFGIHDSKKVWYMLEMKKMFLDALNYSTENWPFGVSERDSAKAFIEFNFKSIEDMSFRLSEINGAKKIVDDFINSVDVNVLKSYGDFENIKTMEFFNDFLKFKKINALKECLNVQERKQSKNKI